MQSKMTDEPVAREREPIERVRAALRPWLWRTLLPAAVLDPSGQASPAGAAAMPNGRCKVHGGKSTGPRTPEA